MKIIVHVLIFTSLFFLSGCGNKIALETTEPVVSPISQPITVQGQAAVINGAKLLARKQAFKMAIRNVSAEAGSRFTTTAILGSTKVVDEWIINDVYHVQVLAILSEGLSCNSPYRKRIIATGFPGVVPGQISASETQDLYSGIPREIMNILMESGGFIGRNKTHTVLYSRPDLAPEIFGQSEYQDNIVVQLAQEQGAQFVLSGVIRDFEVESTEYVRGSGLFSQIKSGMRDFVARRGIGIDIYVHDGASGALLFQHRYTDTVIGDVWIPSGYTVGSERFKATPVGHKVSEIIQLASKDIEHLFACYPFASTVLKVDNNKVYVASGAQDKLRMGDSLVVYAVKGGVEMQENRLIGVINIQDVQEKFSVGSMELASDIRKIKRGDIVKSW